MTNKKVAIMIHTFNRAEFLKNAITKSLEQTYPCEIIVCDHGSTDNTPQMMEQYKDKVTYIRREKDFGPHFCWLEGVLSADAEFIHIQYDDDWIEKDFIEKTVALMQDDVGFAFSETMIFSQETQEKRLCFNLEEQCFKSGIQCNKKLKKKLLDGLMISPGACLFRKKDLVDALYQGNLPILENEYYHGVGPDHFISLLCFLRYNRVGIITEPLAVFREHETSITTSANANSDKTIKMSHAYEAVRVYYRLLEFFKKNKILQLILNKKQVMKKFSWTFKTFLKKIGLRKKEVKPV